MPLFRYRAYTSAGDLAEGEIEAKSGDDAQEALWTRGLTPFETREVKARESASMLRRFTEQRAPNAAEIASFTREFATLEQADVPLDQSLRLLATQSASPPLRALAKEILRHVVDGASLSEALKRQGPLFGDDYINVVRAGESVGKVGPAMTEIADILERRLEVRSRIQSALVYPALLIVLAIISTGVVLGTLVPNIAPIFVDNGKPMPAGLQFVIDMVDNWRIILGVLAAAAFSLFAFLKYAAAHPDVQASVDRTMLRVPYVGALKAQHETARFARTLGSMLKAGVPLLQGLESARAVVADRYLGGQLDTVVEQVRGGANLHTALAQVDKFPTVATQMISIGEEVGKVDEMLMRVAVMFERQTQRSVERVIGLLTPVLTIVIAAVVGGLVMTVMDAVLGINDLASKG